MELSLSLQGIPRDPHLFATLLSIPHFRHLFISARMLCRARRGNIPKKQLSVLVAIEVLLYNRFLCLANALKAG
jgi:hypothetical protein